MPPQARKRVKTEHLGVELAQVAASDFKHRLCQAFKLILRAAGRAEQAVEQDPDPAQDGKQEEVGDDC